MAEIETPVSPPKSNLTQAGTAGNPGAGTDGAGLSPVCHIVAALPSASCRSSANPDPFTRFRTVWAAPYSDDAVTLAGTTSVSICTVSVASAADEWSHKIGKIAMRIFMIGGNWISQDAELTLETIPV
jgi:hypothetical protein